MSKSNVSRILRWPWRLAPDRTSLARKKRPCSFSISRPLRISMSPRLPRVAVSAWMDVFLVCVRLTTLSILRRRSSICFCFSDEEVCRSPALSSLCPRGGFFMSSPVRRFNLSIDFIFHLIFMVPCSLYPLTFPQNQLNNLRDDFLRGFAHFQCGSNARGASERAGTFFNQAFGR